ncbi:MAG: hypothetical protein II588_05410 [Paludibacteraceae bacterium]|nr:hypothetical protein [Paludibacteraceae bacterium]
MKKYLLIAFLAVASICAYAQPRAIGVNLGGNIGFSYQHGFGDANMLDVAVYTPIAVGRGQVWGLSGIVTYDWIDPFGATVPWNEKGEWHWYMGVGGAGGYFFGGNTGYVGAAGHFGIEYDFWFPFQLSLDWRPVIGVGIVGNGGGVAFNTGGLYEGITLGVRYKF